MKKNIYLKESVEGDLDTGKSGKILWLVFKDNKGNSAMINLNNLAHEHRGYVIKSAMKNAIKDYFEARA